MKILTMAGLICVAPALAAQTGPQTAVLAGGCFWGVEAVFERVKGVMDVVSGYSGGTAATADYETVSAGITGHAESVRITFDPSAIAYETLLKVFFTVAHNPTELNRQGPDVGPQYRSVIFFANEAQHRVAQALITSLTQARAYPRPIVTEVVPLTEFYPAEGYHQDYIVYHPTQPYVVFNDLPKLEHLRAKFPDLYQDRKGTR